MVAMWGRNEDSLSNFYLEASRGNIVGTSTVHGILIKD